MTMLSAILAWIVLLGGCFVALTSYPIAAALSLLLATMAVVRLPAMLKRFPNALPIISTVTLAFTCTAILAWVIPAQHFIVQIVVWIATLPALVVWAQSTKETETHSLPSFRAMVHTSVGAVVCMVLFASLTPTSFPDTTLLWITLVSLCLAYPKTGFSIHTEWPRFCTVAFPLALCGLLGFHAYQHTALQNELMLSAKPAAIAEQARALGYTSLHHRAVAHETERLLHTKNWPEAVHAQHRSWANQEPDDFLEAFGEITHPETYPFFSSVAFGTRFRHPDGDAWIDMLALPEREEIWLLDDGGTLWTLGARTIQRTEVRVFGAKAFTIFPTDNRIAILGEMAVFCFDDERWVELPLPQGQAFTDLVFSTDGNRIWMLHENAEVDFYTRLAPGEWQWGGNHILPLWGEDNTAMSFLPLADGETFIVSDRFAGTYVRAPGTEPIAFSPFYNPYRPVSRRVERFSPTRLALLDQYGRIDFMDVPEAGITDNATQERNPVEARIAYQSDEAAWKSAPSALAIQYIPQTHSILQLHSDGRIESIVLPSGYRLRYRDGLPRLPLPQ